MRRSTFNAAGERLRELLKVKEQINRYASSRSKRGILSLHQIIRTSSVGCELLDLNCMQGMPGDCDEWIDESKYLLPSLNVALAVALVKYVATSCGSPFGIQAISPQRRFNEPSLYREIVIRDDGYVLLKFLQIMWLDLEQGVLISGKTHPMWSWVVQMFSEIYPKEGETAWETHDKNPDELTCKVICEELIRLEVEFRKDKVTPYIKEKYVWMVECVNRSVEKLRRKGQQKSIIKRWEQPSVGRHRTGTRALQSLWKTDVSRFLVLRLDLGVRSQGRPIDPYLLRDAFVAFQNKLRFKPLVFKRLLGVMWRLVCTGDTIWHYHCLFVLDGTLIGEHSLYAQLIGEYWVSTLVNEQGWYFDYASHSDPSYRAGTGVIDRTDPNAHDIIFNRVLPDFTRFDLYVRPSLPSRLNVSDLTIEKSLHLFGVRRPGHASL